VILLLALLLAALPERVVIHAREGQKPGLWSKVGTTLSSAVRRLYEKEEPEVAQGNALAAQGDAEGALQQYDKARKRLPDSPALAFDRAAALLKLDAARAPEAASEAGKALQSGDPALRAQAAYQLALAIESMGKPDEAIKAYANALALDPDDRDSKVNLELLLKSQEERKQKRQSGQEQEDKQKQQGDQQKPDKSKGEEEQKDKQKQAGEKKEENKEGQEQAEQQQKAEKKEQRAQAEEKPVDRSEAERLLDALRAGEKNLQAWRFAKDKRKEARRGEPEKDW
jgi:tetratricopeptide (TPR) repeat protein